MRFATGLLLFAAASGWTAPTLEDEHALRLDFVTPHTVWQRPNPKGTTQVLFFSDYRFCQSREIVELMQRFDITADLALYSRIVDTTIDKWHGAEEGLERIRRLLDNDYDVYVFNGVPVSNLPTELQYKLLKRVTEGAGIVLLGVDDQRILKHPAERPAGGPEADLFQVVLGRGARLPAAPTIPYTFGWEVRYDYWQERLGRTLLWAADKLPDAPVSIELKSTETPRGEASLGTVRYGSLPRFRIRRDDGLAIRETALLDGAINASVALPGTEGLPAGAYHVDVFSGPAWATAPFTVTCPRTVALELPRAWGEIGESIAGEVVLGGAALPGERVAVELRDRRGRVFARTAPAAPTGQRVPFSFVIAEWYPMLAQVRAVVSDEAGEAADASAYVNVTKRGRGRFQFLVWDVPSGPTAPYAEEMLARLGMTLQLRGGTPPPFVAAFETSWVPYTTRIMDDKDERGYMKPVPWNQEPEVNEYVAKIAADHQGARQHGVFVYSLGDETVTRGSDLSPSDLAAYRDWLRQVYGDIEALNAAWGETLGSFDEVTLLDPSDPRELTAKRQGRYARWYDRQAWESANFVGLCRRFGDAFRQIDPEAKTGFEGAGRLEDGDDFDGIVRTNGFYSPYPGLADYVIRSIAPRDFPRANWMGYQKDADPLLWTYWRMVLNGCDGAWYWRWDGAGRFNGLLQADLQPYPQITELMEDTRLTREGLGDLLLRSTWLDDGVAMLYSQPSMYAGGLDDSASYGLPAGDHGAWIQAIENLGLDVRYVTDAMLRRGEFDPTRFRILILPRAEALGEIEAKVVRDFVEAGGTVVADLRPGRYTDHCRPRQAGALDDLFGVDSRSSAPALKGAELTIAGELGGAKLALKLGNATVDPGLQLAGGTALGSVGEVPVFVVRRVGQGQAILLNVSLATFPRLNAPESPPAAAELLRAVFASAGVSAPVTLARAGGEPLGDVRAVRWANGQAELLGVMKQPDSVGQIMGMAERTGGRPGSLTITLPRRRHVYDLRRGRYLGETASFEAPFRPGRANFYVLLPAEATPLTARLDPPTASLGTVASLRVAAPGSTSGRAALITASRPDGAEADWLRRVVCVDPDDETVVPVPIAYNDPPGRWTIHVRELFTGAVQTVTLTVPGD